MEKRNEVHDRKEEQFKALSKGNHSSAFADHIKQLVTTFNRDHFVVLAPGKTDYHCELKEALFISSEKLLLN